MPNKPTNLWLFTANCYGEVSVVSWCKVFGSTGEPTHYSNLMNGGPIPSYTKDSIAAELRDAAKLDESAYLQMWEATKKARDEFFVHREFNAETKAVFPDLEKLIAVAFRMRQILTYIVTNSKSHDATKQENIRHHLSYFTNDVFLKHVTDDIPILKKAVAKQ